MNPIVKLLQTGLEEDEIIARAILLSRYKKELRVHTYRLFDQYYIIGNDQIEDIIGEQLIGVERGFIQFDFTEEELKD